MYWLKRSILRRPVVPAVMLLLLVNDMLFFVYFSICVMSLGGNSVLNIDRASLHNEEPNKVLI